VATRGQRHGVCATVRDDPGLRGLRMPGGWWANGVRALRGSGDLMGAAAYNRGSRLVSREADERMPVATSRADAQAHKDEIVRLRDQVTTLERDLRRARRCLASDDPGELVRVAYEHWDNIGWPEDKGPLALLKRAMEVLSC